MCTQYFSPHISFEGMNIIIMENPGSHGDLRYMSNKLRVFYDSHMTLTCVNSNSLVSNNTNGFIFLVPNWFRLPRLSEKLQDVFVMFPHVVFIQFTNYEQQFDFWEINSKFWIGNFKHTVRKARHKLNTDYVVSVFNPTQVHIPFSKTWTNGELEVIYHFSLKVFEKRAWKALKIRYYSTPCPWWKIIDPATLAVTPQDSLWYKIVSGYYSNFSPIGFIECSSFWLRHRAYTYHESKRYNTTVFFSNIYWKKRHASRSQNIIKY